MENEIEKLKKENEELRNKLSERNSTFTEQLGKRVDSKFADLTFRIGEAIRQNVGNDLMHSLRDKLIDIDYDHSSYGKSGYFIRFSKNEDEKNFKQHMEEIELRKFQESLDNFSWAVNNQG